MENEEMLKLLRLLDHPQGVYIVQRKCFSGVLCTENSQELVVEPQTSYERADLCTHCDLTVSVFKTNLWSGPNCNRPCTMSTLQKLVGIIATSESSLSNFSLSSLSSTALCNFLMLIEQNIQFFQSNHLSAFVKVIETYSAGSNDGWCTFLIGHLKRHIEHSNSSDSFCSSLVEGTPSDIPSESILMAMDDDLSSLSKELQTGAGTSAIDDVVEDEGSNRAEKRQDLVFPEVKPNPLSQEQHSHTILASKVYQEWLSDKLADQADFDSLCSLNNNAFSVCMDRLDVSSLSATSVAVISKNISSVKVELSYHNAIALILNVILPLVINLNQAASRDLVLSLCRINSSYPDCFMRGFFLPLLWHQKFGSLHGTLVVKILEDSATKQQMEEVLRCVVRCEKEGGKASWVWTEDVVGVALFLIQEKVSFSNSSVEDLVRVLQRSAEVLIKSSKFAKFMIELCKNIQLKQMISGYKVELLEIAEGHKSILKSALLREVKKLEM